MLRIPFKWAHIFIMLHVRYGSNAIHLPVNDAIAQILVCDWAAQENNRTAFILY